MRALSLTDSTTPHSRALRLVRKARRHDEIRRQIVLQPARVKAQALRDLRHQGARATVGHRDGHGPPVRETGREQARAMADRDFEPQVGERRRATDLGQRATQMLGIDAGSVHGAGRESAFQAGNETRSVFSDSATCASLGSVVTKTPQCGQITKRPGMRISWVSPIGSLR